MFGETENLVERTRRLTLQAARPDHPRLNDYITGIIRRERQQRGWTVAYLSGRAAIPLGSYSNIEVGRYRLGALNLLRLQVALQMPIDQLWPPVGLEVEQVTGSVLSAILSDAEAHLPGRLTVPDIIDAVCNEFGVTPGKLASPSRVRHLNRARVAAAVLVQETPGLTIVELSRHFNRHYSTLLHSAKWAKLEPRDEKLWGRVHRLSNRIDELQGNP